MVSAINAYSGFLALNVSEVRPVTKDNTGLKVLYNPSTNSGSASTPPDAIDIVAIHGIGAHPDDTWCKNIGRNRQGEPLYVNWLKDKHMLPSIVPNARIMRYGYESWWFGTDAIRQHASTVAIRFLLALNRERSGCESRPLLFIAHCFGGLVIMKALLEAQHQTKKWPGIFHSSAGLIFFGTPFRGAEGMSHSEMIQAAYREYRPEQVQEKVLQILEPGNEFLQDLVDKFGETRAQKHKAKIACFFELKPSDVGAIVGGQARIRFIVSQSSGCLDLTRSTEKYSLARSHFDMNKFGKLKEEDFQTVCDVIKRMVKSAPKLLLARSQDAKRHSIHCVPFSLQGLPLVNRFVGRHAEMLRLEEYFHSKTLGPTRRKVFVVHGLGGMGKTQLAIEFVREHHSRHSAVFWLDGSSKDRLQQSYVDVLSKLPRDQVAADAAKAMGDATINKEKAVQGALEWLSLPSNPNWLLIIDNVDRDYLSKDKDPQAYDVNDFFPSAEHGSILITSRLAGLHRRGESQKLGTVDADQAKAILVNNAGRSIKDVNLIVEELKGLPLALTQAGAYLGQTNMAASDYVKHYHSTWKDLMKKQDRFPLQEYADRSVLTTWKISYERVRGRSEEAAGLLRLWGFLDCGDLWYELVAKANSLDRTIEKPSWLPRLVKNNLEFSEALQILSRYSLVDAKVQASGHSIHSVLHEWCYHLAEGKERRMLFWVAASIVARAAREQSEPKYEMMCNLPSLRNRLLPHGNRVVRVADEESFQQPLDSNDLGVRASVFFGLGMLFDCGPKLNEAKKMYLRAISVYSSALGPTHKLTLDTMSKLGDIYSRQGKLSEAEWMYEQALAKFETTFEPTYTSTVNTINELGHLYWEQRKLGEAEKLYRRALAKFKTTLGPTHSTTLCTIRYLGDIYREQVKVDEAKKMYRRAMTGYEGKYGPDHELTSSVRKDLRFLW